MNESIPLVGFFIIDVDKFPANFTPGYQNLTELLTGLSRLDYFGFKIFPTGYNILPTSLCVLEKSNVQSVHSSNAFMFLLATLSTAVIIIFLIDLLPETVSSLLSFFIFGASFTFLFRTS